MISVSEQTILDALHQVPPERWDEVLQYIYVLNTDSSPIRTAADLLKSGQVGMWADRDDIGDSREFARRLRQQSETRSRSDDAPGH